jgi:4-hydroxybenzoate polyprenyltransferase
MTARLREYWMLMRLHRPIGALLLLWPTLWALWLAGEGRPQVGVVIIFVLGVFLMRSAGCVINDYADRDFDRHVKRTQDRPLTAGRVSEREALTLFVVLSLVAFVLVLQLNWLTIALSVVGALLAASYPFMKRYTHLPQFYLGVAFAWGVPMAYAALTGTVPPLAWLLLAASLFWTVAYDTEYAMVDRDDDLRIGIKSTAILFGAWDRAMIALAHAASLGLLVIVGLLADRGLWFYLGLVAALATAMYQQRLIRGRDRERSFRAFLNNNFYGAAIFVGLVLDYLLGR